MNRFPTLAVVLAWACTLALPAWAHRPSFDQGFDDPEGAFRVEDPEISIVVYKEVTCESPALWLTFEADEGFPLYMQLGVPDIYRLTDYHPRLVLLHPGLPELDTELPFEVPEGLGGLVMDADPAAGPDEFYEPFTGTDSWVWVEETIELPQSGRGYVVAYDPQGWTGKLWIALGTVEDFSDVNPTMFGEWMHEVNAFHETGAFDEPPLHEDESCATDTAEGDTHPGAGCKFGSDRHSSPAGLLLLLALAAIRPRGRRPPSGQ